MAWWDKTAFILANIGAINWGLATLGWNAVDKIFGAVAPWLATTVYYVVALCGIYALVRVFK